MAKEPEVGNRECEHLRTRVVSTWRSRKLIRRQRQCLDCQARFDTRETADQPESAPAKSVIAANGNNPHCHVKNE